MEPYPHQDHVYDLLGARRNVILRAPTGSGKTQAAIFPYLAAMDTQSNMAGQLPRKCIYSVPMRVLAKQFHAEYRKSVNRYNNLYDVAIKTSIQTGDMPQDPKLERDLIFATIDQTLSSFLMAPYGLSRGQANLNLGALLSSYLVFDEFHLFDPDSTLPTTLQMLRMLKGITPFVLMTATFSDTLITRLAAMLDADVVGLSETDRASFAGLQSQDKERRYHAVDEPLTLDTVLDTHTGRSVVICNTVRRAREMAVNLRKRAANTEVLLLHSQFLREDRDRIEDRIQQDFGKGNEEGSLIVVATQAIEVGVDITSTVMHTELAPANAIIQRAGRCARYQGNQGDVYIYSQVYDRGELRDIAENPAPYVGDRYRDQIARAFDAFRERTGEALNFDDEQAVIDVVHGPSDHEMLNALDADSASHRASMFAAMRGEPEYVGELVRHVISQPVTIHHEPNSAAVLEQPYRLPSFNLHPGTLRGLVKDWLSRYHVMDDHEAPPFAVKYLHSETDPDDSTRQLHRWEDVPWTAPPTDAEDQSPRPQLPTGTLVMVHPALASYDTEWGFQPELPGQPLAFPEDDGESSFTPHTYRLETYAQHIDLVYHAAFKDWRDRGHTAYWHELEWAAHRLAARMGLTYEQIRHAAELTVLLHDVGKLGKGWQGWVRDYQAAIDKPTDTGEAYAHTDSTTDAHRAVEKGMRKRPPHAVESAVAAAPLLMTLSEKLRQAAFTAICRHHGAFTSAYQGIELMHNAADKVHETVDADAVTLYDKRTVAEVPMEMFVSLKDSTIDQFFAYALFVRLLRRSDGRGTMWNSFLIESNANE